MRVIAGIARSLPLLVPEGKNTRPTTDRIKETLFNILQSGLCDCVFVDLFSGSGGVAIEALSRGAKKAYLVDNDRNAISCIKQNLVFTKLDDSAVVWNKDAVDAVQQIQEKADIIFMDPPYGMHIEEELMKALKNSTCLTKETMIIIEAEKHRDFSDIVLMGYELVREKVYKTNKHVFFKIAEEEV